MSWMCANCGDHKDTLAEFKGTPCETSNSLVDVHDMHVLRRSRPPPLTAKPKAGRVKGKSKGGP